MKKIFVTLAAALLVLCAFTAPKVIRTVTYQSSVECKKCEQKVMNTVAFEKGVQDLKVDLKKQTVTITFDEAKTDTTTLANALRKIGYTAKVVSFE